MILTGYSSTCVRSNRRELSERRAVSAVREKKRRASWSKTQQIRAIKVSLAGRASFIRLNHRQIKIRTGWRATDNRKKGEIYF